MKVAFLGTGLMGLPMAQRLLAADIQLVAYNRTPEKLAPLKDHIIKFLIFSLIFLIFKN